jgi:hypothetical protein
MRPETPARQALTLEQWHAYVMAQPADGHAGMARDSECCPFACYLQRFTSYGITFGMFEWYEGAASGWDVPTWVRRIQREIDKHPEQAITFGEIRAIMERLNYIDSAGTLRGPRTPWQY